MKICDGIWISIFMPDGTDGIKIVKVEGWNGVCVVCPRAKYFDAKNRPEFGQGGVYLLISEDEESPKIYIGQTSEAGKRIAQHMARTWWKSAFVFTRQGESSPLHKSALMHLESQLFNKARAIGRCNVEFGQKPADVVLSDEDKFAAEKYLNNILRLLPILGVRVFEDAPEREKSGASTEYCHKGENFDARGYETANGFVVVKGSVARKAETKSLLPVYSEERKRLNDSGVLVPSDNEKEMRFSKNHEFNAPSRAASVVSGRNENGRAAWKSSNKTLKENQEKEAG